MPKQPPKSSPSDKPVQPDGFYRIHPDPPPEHIQKLYDELHRLERQHAIDLAVVLGCRRILTDAFFLLNHPFDSIPPEYDPDLHYAEEEDLYFKSTPSPKLPREFAAHLRQELNQFVHSHASLHLDAKKIVDLLNVVRCVLDDLFGRNTPSSEEIPPLKEPRIQLNARQLAAACSKSRLTRVNAGPGTGKTHLLAYRLLHSACTSRDRQIIGLAYTNEAADALQRRITDSAYGTVLHPLLAQIRVYTIHSFANRVILDFYRAIGQPVNFRIIERDEEDNFRKTFPNDSNAFYNFLRHHNLLTFKMILDRFIQELNKQPALIDYIQNNIAEIALDEAQDASPETAKIIQIIYTRASTRIFLVGDQRQNIFRFNNGSFHNFETAGLPLEKEAQSFELVECYRCPQSVLNLANSLSFQNDCPNTRLLHPDTPSGPLAFTRYNDQGAEAEAIVEKIAKMERPFSDIAILVPTSYQFADFTSRLKDRNIPFRCIGGQTKLQPTIKTLVRCLESIFAPATNLPLLLAHLDALPSQNRQPTSQPFATNLNPLGSNRFALPAPSSALPALTEPPHWTQPERMPNTPQPSKECVSNFATFDKLLDFARCAKQGLKKLFLFLDDYLPSTPDVPTDTPDLEDLINDFEIAMEDIQPGSKSLVRRFHSAVKNACIYRIEDLKSQLSPENEAFREFYIGQQFFDASTTGENGQYVTISTIHSAKGREWPIVFLPSLTDGLFPSYKSFDAPELQLDEIKKFYVACTRPSKSLILSWVASYRTKTGQQKNKLPPDFLYSAILLGILTPVGGYPNPRPTGNAIYRRHSYRYR